MFTRTQLVVICKGKLIAIDALLPLLLEIKAKYSKLKIILILPDASNYDSVSKNYHLLECIKNLNAEFIFQPRGGRRITLYSWTVKLFLRLCFKRNIIISTGASLLKHDFFVYCIKKISKSMEFRFVVARPAPELIQNMKINQAFLAELSGKSKQEKVKEEMKYDYFLSSTPFSNMDIIANEKVPEDRYINIGYVRSFPTWLEFVDKTARTWKDSHKGKYCLFILSRFTKRDPLLNEPPTLDLFIETIQILREFSSDLHIVFKPHVITEMDLFHKAVEDLELTNFSIDYGHPMILSKHAQFIVGNWFSSTFFDAYYLNCPVVEYASYDPILMERIGNRSYGAPCCDFFSYRDQNELRKAVQAIMKEEFQLKRDSKYIADNFTNNPGRFFQLLNDFTKS